MNKKRRGSWPSPYSHRLLLFFGGLPLSSQRGPQRPFLGLAELTVNVSQGYSLTTDGAAIFRGCWSRFLTISVRLPNFILCPSDCSGAVPGEGVFSNTSFSAINGNKELVVCFFLFPSPLEPSPSPKWLKENLWGNAFISHSWVFHAFLFLKWVPMGVMSVLMGLLLPDMDIWIKKKREFTFTFSWPRKYAQWSVVCLDEDFFPP